jgi:putative nucleotidyltransferase with HDIG domain
MVLPVIWLASLMAMIFTSGHDITVLVENYWYLLTGIAPAPVAMVLANYVLDAAFNIPTASRLQEFDNQDHPLLRKLQFEAPGTWHHSMMVGLIAEAACQAIGGNTQLVRVACMFHDVGKTRRPEFFIENQRGGINLHDKYSPWLSKIIVEGHVKDGVTMAKAHGLPQELIDMIPEHHGTSLIMYFFRKALAMSEDGYVNEYDYRYPGPKPQTAEAACINLADAAESATRALDEPTPHRIESLVNRIYEDRLLDGQYDECGLALNQLETIKTIITNRLVGAYHARIDYPEEEELKRQLQLKRAEAEKGTKVDSNSEDKE